MKSVLTLGGVAALVCAGVVLCRTPSSTPRPTSSAAMANPPETPPAVVAQEREVVAQLPPARTQPSRVGPGGAAPPPQPDGLQPVHKQSSPALTSSGLGEYRTNLDWQTIDLPAKKLEPKLAQLVEAAITGSPDHQAQAIRDLKALNPTASEAALTELCRRTLAKATRNQALDALEKVRPDLYPPVRVITTTADDYFGLLRALMVLKELRTAARPALPVLREQCKRWEAEFDKLAGPPKDEKDESPWAGISAMLGNIYAIYGTLAPVDDAAFQLLVNRVKFGLDAQDRSKDDVGDLIMQSMGPVALLGQVAQSTPARRQDVVQAVLPLLKLKAEWRVLKAIEVLGQCAEAGEPALPALKERKYARSLGVQQAADQAVRDITAMIAAAKVLPPESDLREVCDKYGDINPYVRLRAREMLGKKHARLAAIAARLFFEPEQNGTYARDSIYQNLGKVLDEVTAREIDPTDAAALIEGHLKFLRRQGPQADPFRNPDFSRPGRGATKEFDALVNLHLKLLARMSPVGSKSRNEQADIWLKRIAEGRATARKERGQYKYTLYGYDNRREGEKLGKTMMEMLPSDDRTVPDALIESTRALVDELDRLGATQIFDSDETEFENAAADLGYLIDVLGEVAAAQPATRSHLINLVLHFTTTNYGFKRDAGGKQGLDAEFFAAVVKCGAEARVPLEKLAKETRREQDRYASISNRELKLCLIQALDKLPKAPTKPSAPPESRGK